MNIELNIYIPQVKIISHNNIVVGARMVLLSPAFMFEQEIDHLKDPKESASTQSSFRRQGHRTRSASHR